MKKKIFLSIIFLVLFFINLQKTAIADTNNPYYPTLANMLEKIMPSVVSIDVEGKSYKNTKKIQPFFQPFFGFNSPFCQEGSPFHGSPMCQNNENESNLENMQKFRALGSGVIIDAIKGYIVTNYHVVDNATKIQVQINDGHKYNANIVGKDPKSDIAVLQIKEFKNLTAIKMADSDKLKVGDYAVAIGNPYGLGETVTSGIISALGRSGLNSENYENFIQTDAAINRGNSGGALVNINGELIGINTAILAPDGGNIGIGFAIPSNMVKNLVLQMLKYGHVKRGELGIIGTELNAELSKVMKVDSQKGAFVTQVIENSSADIAGIRPGDIILLADQRPILSFSALRAYLGTLPIGKIVKLGVLRNGKVIMVNVELKASNKKNIDDNNNYEDIENYSIIEGATLGNYHDNSNKKNKGVIVLSVRSNSIASQIDFKKNDLILSLNQEKIDNIEDLKKIIESKPDILVFKVKREKSIIYLFMQQ